MTLRFLSSVWLSIVFVTASCAANAAGERWVGSWVSAQQIVEPHNLPPPPGLGGHTLRQVIQPALGGSQARVVISNVFGDAPLTVAAVHLAQSAGASGIVPETDCALLFSGRPTVTIQPGTSVLSDPAPLAVEAFQNLAVSIAVQDMPPQVTGHPGSRTTSYIVPGQQVSASQLPDAVTVDRWYLLARLEVLTDASAGAIVVIGDSITDGRGSTTNQNDRWPNVLARRLHAHPATSRLAVLNQGIGGGRLLRDGLGPSALARFDRDVLAPPGVDALIVFIGVNDLGTAVGARANGQPAATADDLIAGYQQLIRRAKSHGLKVIGATITPFSGFEMYDTPESEADRQKVNEWIRTSGEYDAVIDFDAIARDRENLARLSAAVDGGDRLHPSAEGYRIMAEAIDLGLFERPAPRPAVR